MNTLYPHATAEELAAVDNVCIICLEEMQVGTYDEITFWQVIFQTIFVISCVHLNGWIQFQEPKNYRAITYFMYRVCVRGSNVIKRVLHAVLMYFGLLLKIRLLLTEGPLRNRNLYRRRMRAFSRCLLSRHGSHLSCRHLQCHLWIEVNQMHLVGVFVYSYLRQWLRNNVILFL